MHATTTQALLAIGLHPEEAGLVALLPLIEVAWADGAVQAAEQRFILKKAEELLYMTPHSREVLQGWLSWPPSETTLRHGRTALADIARQGHLPSDLLDLAAGVAKAAGGVLGLGSVDAREREVLERLEASIARGEEEAETLHVYDEDDDEPDTDIGPSPLVQVHRWTDPQGTQQAAMLVLSGGSTTTGHLLNDDSVSIGRHRTCTLKLRGDSQISRRHCRVVRRDGAWFVEDLSSANGTYVNGDRISVRRLLGGEQIRVGGTLMRFVAAGG